MTTTKTNPDISLADRIHALRESLAHQAARAPVSVTRRGGSAYDQALELAQEIVEARAQHHWAGSHKVEFMVKDPAVRGTIREALARAGYDTAGW